MAVGSGKVLSSANCLVVREPAPVAVIGDIHGRSDLLARLLKGIGHLPILVLGDVCDRGPDTKGVLDLLIAHGARGTLGNHDEWFVEWANGRGFDRLALAPMMGGQATLRSYGVVGTSVSEVEAQTWRVPEAHREWLGTLAWAIDLEAGGQKYWLVHAGVAADDSWSEMGIKSLEEVVPVLAERRSASLHWAMVDPDEMIALARPVVMGHRVLREPIDLPHVLAIDTGCGTVEEGTLTAVVLPERRMVSVR